MSSRPVWSVGLTLALALGFAAAPRSQAQEGKPWRIKADLIEACSCHLFCACYFYTSPEGGHMCEFNNAVKVREGAVGAVQVDGCAFWLSGDLGGDFSKGEMKGAVITFDPAVTPEQRAALKFLIGKIYPVTWGKLEEDTAPIRWERTGANAHAQLGEAAEVTLTAFTQDGTQTVIQGLRYWGAQKNSGFYLAKSTHYYKGHGYDYRHEDRNGFCIQIESSGTEPSPSR